MANPSKHYGRANLYMSIGLALIIIAFAMAINLVWHLEPDDTDTDPDLQEAITPADDPCGPPARAKLYWLNPTHNQP